MFVYDFIGNASGGSDTAWFVMDGGRHELNFFWRIKPEFKWDEDFDTFVAKYRGYMRYSFGYSDWKVLLVPLVCKQVCVRLKHTVHTTLSSDKWLLI